VGARFCDACGSPIKAAAVGPERLREIMADLVRDYRAMAESLGYEGHMARAEAMK
jgi:hypothetical protein